jgi:hypothetical protein
MSLLDLFHKACNSADKTAGNETQYAITEDTCNVYLAIQGSVEFEDWIYNFDFIAKPYRNMGDVWYTHRGFANCWKLARDQIVQEVLDTLGNKRLVILGYSHGAAIALLAHEYFVYNGYSPETYCFGCPRVLWIPNKRILSRFTNVHLISRRGDLVTKVPFAWMGFRHPVKQTLFGSSALTWWRRHLIPEYIEALAE